MPDILMSLQIIFALAGSMGYTGIRYADWLKRNHSSQDVSTMSPLPASVNLRVAAKPLHRRSPSPRGSPRRKSQGELGPQVLTVRDFGHGEGNATSPCGQHVDDGAPRS
ncbi:hypothetical protein FGB62_159g111 [Gracilaria domingensis]|nr:hypothetical protein FGB62_159g111 [Gracilaria domingensis]